MPRSALSLLCCCAFFCFAASSSQAQATKEKGSPASAADGRIVTDESTPMTPAELKESAWTLLSIAIDDTRKGDERSQALSAICLLGNSPRGLKLITDAMADKDLDIRSAAALAAGETKVPAIATPLRAPLDDKEPPVAFAAAVALAKMNDRSGEDILLAVAEGDRGTSHIADQLLVLKGRDFSPAQAE